MFRTTSIIAVSIALAGSIASAATSYSTGFEDFTLGPISPGGGPAQGGWSGGAQPGFTNSGPGDEEVVNTQANTGSQSWHYARGYNSPGQGTAFTPNLDTAVSAVGSSMTGSVAFKAGTAGDNSSFAIETGNMAGNDRAEYLAYVENLPGGIAVRSFDGTALIEDVDIASGLDNTAWHKLDFTLTRTDTGNSVSISVDNATPVNFAGDLAPYRDSINAPYSESSRLKFRPRNLDTTEYNGFYLDDVSYSVSVPEPTTLAVVGLGAAGLLMRRRRQTA